MQSKMKVRIAPLKCSVVSASVINRQRTERGDQNLNFQQVTDRYYFAIILVRMFISTFSVENIIYQDTKSTFNFLPKIMVYV